MLTDLDLSYNAQIQGLEFLSHLPQLKKLSLSNCISLRRFHVITYVLLLHDLTYLDLSESCSLRSKDIVRIANKLSKLQHLNIHETVSLPHMTVTFVDNKLSELQEFLFCVTINFENTSPWVNIYLQYPLLQICPAALDVILEKNRHLLQ